MKNNHSDLNGFFLQEYNLLDSLCKSLSPRGEKTVSGMHNLEKTLYKQNDYTRATKLKSIVRYKNNNFSHTPFRAQPSTPPEYVSFLRGLRLEVTSNTQNYKALFAQVERGKRGENRNNDQRPSQPQRTIQEETISQNKTYDDSDDKKEIFLTAYLPTIVSCFLFILIYTLSTIFWWMCFFTGVLSCGIFEWASRKIEEKYTEFYDFEDLDHEGKHATFAILIMFLADVVVIFIDWLIKKNTILLVESLILFLPWLIIFLLNRFFWEDGDTDWTIPLFFKPYTINIYFTFSVSFTASMFLIPVSSDSAIAAGLLSPLFAVGALFVSLLLINSHYEYY